MPSRPLSASSAGVCTSTFSYQHTFPTFPPVCTLTCACLLSLSLASLTQIPVHRHPRPLPLTHAHTHPTLARLAALQLRRHPPRPLHPFVHPTVNANPIPVPLIGTPHHRLLHGHRGRLTRFMAPGPQTRAEVHKGMVCRCPAP